MTAGSIRSPTVRMNPTTSDMTTQGATLRKVALRGVLLTTLFMLTGCYEHVVSVKGGPYSGMVYKSNLDDSSKQSSNAAEMRDRANADYQKQVKELQKPREN